MRAAVLLSVVVLAGIPGCGGGSSGTGGSGFGVSGTLRTAANVPVPGVQVSVTQSGAAVMRVSYSAPPEFSREMTQDVTDAQGQFSLSLDQRPESLTLLLQGQTFDSTVDIPTVPATAATLNLALIYNTETETVEEQDERFEDDEGMETKRLK